MEDSRPGQQDHVQSWVFMILSNDQGLVFCLPFKQTLALNGGEVQFLAQKSTTNLRCVLSFSPDFASKWPKICDPKVLLQGPKTSKVPKVVRRGCKRCFGPREQRSPKSLLHHQNPVLHRVQLSFAPVQEDFGALGPKHLLHPLLTTLGTFEVSGPCSRTFGSQPKMLFWA